MNNEVMIYPGIAIKKTDVGEPVSVPQVLQWIKEGKYKGHCDKAREALAEGKYAEHQKTYQKHPCVTWPASWPEGKDTTKPSISTGIVVVEYDKQDKILESEYLLFMCKSRSGEGRHPGFRPERGSGADTYNIDWLHIAKTILKPAGIKADTNAKNYDRAFYLSYDPDIFINLDAPLVPIAGAILNANNLIEAKKYIRGKGLTYQNIEGGIKTSTLFCHAGDNDEQLIILEKNGKLEFYCKTSEKGDDKNCPTKELGKREERDPDQDELEFCRLFIDRLRWVDGEILTCFNGEWEPLFDLRTRKPTEVATGMLKSAFIGIKQSAIEAFVKRFIDANKSPDKYGIPRISNVQFDDRRKNMVFPLMGIHANGGRRGIDLRSGDIIGYTPEMYMRNNGYEGALSSNFEWARKVKICPDEHKWPCYICPPESNAKRLFLNHYPTEMLQRLASLLRGTIKDTTIIIIPTSSAGKSILAKLLKLALGNKAVEIRDGDKCFSNGKTFIIDLLSRCYLVFIEEADDYEWPSAEFKAIAGLDTSNEIKFKNQETKERMGAPVFLCGANLQLDTSAQGINTRVTDLWNYPDLQKLPESLYDRILEDFEGHKSGLEWISAYFLELACNETTGRTPDTTAAADEWLLQNLPDMVQGLRSLFYVPDTKEWTDNARIMQILEGAGFDKNEVKSFHKFMEKAFPGVKRVNNQGTRGWRILPFVTEIMPPDPTPQN